jgi:hypothetical protein
MPSYVLNALLGNAATLGIHWIYNPEYLAKLSQKQSLFFLKQDAQRFKEAQPSYFAYPKTEVGDVTSQGMILFWLFEALRTNPNLTKEQYQVLIFDHIRPGGDYEGYIETYGHKLIINQLNQHMKLNLPQLPIDDDHLIGFIPYMACKQLGLPLEKAWEIAQALTNKEEYLHSYHMFDAILNALSAQGLKEILPKAIQLAPKRFTVQLQKALSMTDTTAFVKDYAGPACAINQSVPIIIHLLYHSTSLLDAWQRNALIGGAIAERAMLLSMIMGEIDPPSSVMIGQLSKKFLSISLGS